ncbi:hypothetical protein ACFXKD_11320 [Nocardiopsis aegyptia]|uniref:hypothetical protein n=1 Tax=Nocardiopsis aegyptia TaxID=220378 RepID=UPI003671EDF5
MAELSALADEDRMAGRRVHLNALADDLRKEQRLERWAEMDLSAAFPTSESVGPRSRSGRLPDVVETLPTVLVFLPILITWAGLALAAGAYGRSRQDAALEGLSFLERWQDGFNGALPVWLAFDNVALCTLGGIIILIGGVVAQSLYRRWDDGQDQAERTALERRLVSALAAAQFELGAVRLGSPARIASELGASVQQLREVGLVAQRAQQEVRTTLAETRECLRSAQSTISVLKEGNDSVTGAVQEGLDVVRDLYERFGEVSTAIDRVADASDTLSAAGAEERARSREEMTRVADRLAGEVRDLVSQSHEALAGTVSGASDVISHALSSGEHGIRTALEEWQENGTGFAHRAELAADLSGRVAESLRDLPDAVLRLREGIDELHESVERTAGAIPEPTTATDADATTSTTTDADGDATDTAADSGASEHGLVAP